MEKAAYIAASAIFCLRVNWCQLTGLVFCVQRHHESEWQQGKFPYFFVYLYLSRESGIRSCSLLHTPACFCSVYLRRVLTRLFSVFAPSAQACDQQESCGRGCESASI